eukprot:jgi/Botrbrau1/17324/Bobra.0015s0071.2
MAFPQDQDKESSLPKWGRKGPRGPRGHQDGNNVGVGYAPPSDSGSGHEEDDENLERLPPDNSRLYELASLACLAELQSGEGHSGVSSSLRERGHFPPIKKQKTSRARSGDFQGGRGTRLGLQAEDLHEGPPVGKPVWRAPPNRKESVEVRNLPHNSGIHSPRAPKRAHGTPGSPVARRLTQLEGPSSFPGFAPKKHAGDRDLPRSSGWGGGHRTGLIRDRGLGNENSAQLGTSGFRNGQKTEQAKDATQYTYNCKKGQRHLSIAYYIQTNERKKGARGGPPPSSRIASVQAPRPEKQIQPKATAGSVSRERLNERLKPVSLGHGLPSAGDVGSSQSGRQVEPSSSGHAHSQNVVQRKASIKMEPGGPASALSGPQSLVALKASQGAHPHFPMRQPAGPHMGVPAAMVSQMSGSHAPMGPRTGPPLLPMGPPYTNPPLGHLLLSNLGGQHPSMYPGMGPGAFGAPGSLLQGSALNSSMASSSLALAAAAMGQQGPYMSWAPPPANLISLAGARGARVSSNEDLHNLIRYSLPWQNQDPSAGSGAP